MAITKDYNILPKRSMISVEPKDPKAYIFALSKVVALTGLAPVLGGIVGFYSELLGLVVMIAAVIAAIWFGLRFMKMCTDGCGLKLLQA